MFKSLRRLAFLVADAICLRLELVLLEGQELGLRLLIYLSMVLMAGALFLTGWFMVNMLVVLVFWEHRIWAVAGMLSLNLVGSVLLLVWVWHRYHADGPFFVESMAELKRDRQSLGDLRDAADQDTP